MRFLIALLTVFCLVEASQAYLCYECNSTIDLINCFDFSPTFSYYKAVNCDEDGTGATNCYSVQVSERKQRRMFRGCKKAGICENYEDKERTFDFKLLTCNECHENYCNGAPAEIRNILFITFLSILFTRLFR